MHLHADDHPKALPVVLFPCSNVPKPSPPVVLELLGWQQDTS